MPLVIAITDPLATDATMTVKAGEAIVFSYQSRTTAGVVNSMADDGFVFAVYETATRNQIGYYDAKITTDSRGDIALWVLDGSVSELFYGKTNLRWDIAQRGLGKSRDTILQGSMVVKETAPFIEGLAGEPVARYIQKLVRANDPHTMDKPNFAITLEGYSPADTTPTTPAATLGSLALSSASATVGTSYSGTITGATAGSTITVSNLPAGLTLNSALRTITGTPTTAGTANFTLVETLAGATNSPKINGVTLTIASATVTTLTLGALALSSTSGQVGTAFNASITGATNGSTLSSSDLPAGLTLNSSARTITGTPTATSSSFTLVETLAGATGSPKSNTVALTISPAATTPTPTPSAWSFDRTDFTFDATNWTWDRIDGSGVVPPAVSAITLALSAAQSVAEGNPSSVAAITLALSAAQSIAEGNPTGSSSPAITLALSNAQAVAEGNPASITLALSGAQAVAEGT